MNLVRETEREYSLGKKFLSLKKKSSMKRKGEIHKRKERNDDTVYCWQFLMRRGYFFK